MVLGLDRRREQHGRHRPQDGYYQHSCGLRSYHSRITGDTGLYCSRIDNWILWCIQNVRICVATMLVRHDMPVPKRFWNGREEMQDRALKQRHGAIRTWQNAQQMCGAIKHIRDNDTSGFWIRSGHRMTVQFRCGQRNELPPVCGFMDLGNRKKISLLLFAVMDWSVGDFTNRSLKQIAGSAIIKSKKRNLRGKTYDQNKAV